MGSSLKTNAVRDLLKYEQPDLLLLQETKITEQEFQNHRKKRKKYAGVATSTAGASGGIGTLWDKNKWEFKEKKAYSWWVRTDIRDKATKDEYTIYNIYAPNHYRDKASCWDTITSNLMTVQGRNIFLGGDLNLIRNADEKLGGNFYADPSRDSLEAIIQTHNLVDTPPLNGRFTWSNKRIGNSNIKERLDRILVKERIVARFSNIQRKIIQGYFSDHKPVARILDKGKNMGPLPFKYNKAWDSKEEFRALVKEQWAKEVIGSPHFIWESKIKNLRNVIKRWAKNYAVEESKKRAALQTQLEQWNQDKERTQFTEEDQAKENEMYRDLENNDRGRELRDQEEIKEAAFNHFSALLTADPQPVDSVDFLSPIENKITADQNNELEKEVTVEEIEWSIFIMAQEKAPGPDGFTVAFYRTHWEIIKKDFVRMVNNFFSKSKLGNNIKSSHLALIPKDPNPQSFDRFRPISLCNVSYKIITKILANRIKNLLPSLISENQGGFVPKRHITDNVILIQEAIHSSINRKEKGMIIKLDMANAFDRVNHQFLKAVLEKFGVSSIFISRIMECISLPWTARLINSRPSNFFRSSRGLRQGCPLSPFLYIIMAETLSIHLEKLRRKKEITGISIARETKEINHSLFTDDTLLIGGASSLMARRFKKMLDLFLQVSGGKLNNNKCMLYTWNVPRHITQRISIILDIPAQRNWIHFMYLGLPLAKDSIKTEIWVKVIENLRGKLQSWGMSWLNLAGRTTLIKAILSSLPIYQFAITLTLASSHKHMELILRSFLWQGGKQDSKNFSLVKWDQVILPFEKGGIGIIIPRLANMAMGFKLIWRILSEKGAWWTEAMKRKYLNGINSNILVDPIADRQCTPVWKLIKKTLPLLKGYISRAPGNGSGINIWTERIMGTEARDTLPNLRPLHLWMEAKKLKSLYDISIWEQNRWLGWKHLRLPYNLREQWADLKLSLTGSTPLNRLSKDRYMWDPNGGSCTVKEGYKILQNTSAINNWPLHKVVWNPECLPKVKFFNWTLLKRKILTTENLRKRGILGPSICCLCREAEESSNHLFLECTRSPSCKKIGGTAIPTPRKTKPWPRDCGTASPQTFVGKSGLPETNVSSTTRSPVSPVLSPKQLPSSLKLSVLME
eukprot:PITA_17777